MIAVDILKNRYVTRILKEPIGTTRLWNYCSRKMTSMLLETYKSGWLDRRMKTSFLNKAYVRKTPTLSGSIVLIIDSDRSAQLS